MQSSLSNGLLLFVIIIVILSQTSIAKYEADVEYYPYPNPDAGYVSDHIGLLTAEEEERIENWLWQVEYRSGVEIVVVIVNSISDYPYSDNNSIEAFSTGLFNAYGIGNLPKNNGVLFLVARGDRKARIELGEEYGHSRDQEAQQIMNQIIIPSFKDGNYVIGITDGTEAIIEEFAEMRIGFPWHIVWIGGFALACLLIGISCFVNGKKSWGYVFVGFAIILILLAVYLLVQIARQLPNSNSDTWSSGGIGGFGGGSSGGGGATGDW